MCNYLYLNYGWSHEFRTSGLEDLFGKLTSGLVSSLVFEWGSCQSFYRLRVVSVDPGVKLCEHGLERDGVSSGRGKKKSIVEPTMGQL